MTDYSYLSLPGWFTTWLKIVAALSFVGFFARGTPAYQIAEELKNVLERVSASFYGQNNKSFGEYELASELELENDSGEKCSRGDFFSTKKNPLNGKEKTNLLRYALLTGLCRVWIKEPIRIEWSGITQFQSISTYTQCELGNGILYIWMSFIIFFQSCTILGWKYGSSPCDMKQWFSYINKNAQ